MTSTEIFIQYEQTAPDYHLLLLTISSAAGYEEMLRLLEEAEKAGKRLSIEFSLEIFDAYTITQVDP